MKKRVSVTIVTFDSGAYIRACLDSLLCQTGVDFEVVVVDNNSSDGTRQVLEGFADRVRIFHNPRNIGFAAAQNQAIAATSGDWILTLNPDAVLQPGFLERLLEAGETDVRIGTVCGKLLSIASDLKPASDAVIDSAGIVFTPNIRHFDRGWHEPDGERFDEVEYVFGASAAAALYRREMIDDVSIGGEFFDSAFFAYREDADVAWRAQLLGWRCLYDPGAVAYHVRRVNPANRRQVPAFINMHSVKNRFLMRIKNATPGLYRQYWLPMTFRDVVVAAGCLMVEQSSLPAFWHVARYLTRALEHRREIMKRRRVSDDDLLPWFAAEPRRVALDAPSLSRVASSAGD